MVYKCSLQMDKRPESKDKTKILIEAVIRKYIHNLGIEKLFVF